MVFWWLGLNLGWELSWRHYEGCMKSAVRHFVMAGIDIGLSIGSMIVGWTI